MSTDVFYPADSPNGHAIFTGEEAAKTICAGCPVKIPCRDWALTAGETYGIWGGTTPTERLLVGAAHRHSHVDTATSDLRATERPAGEDHS